VNSQPSTLNPQLPLTTARRYADHIVTWLSPYCERIEIAGSIRRQRPTCGDIDLVIIPKITDNRDMLNELISRQNHCWEFLRDYVASKAGTACAPSFSSGGERPGKYAILQLPKCQLDVWFADRATWATRLLCRTGSKEHNIWLAQRAQARGYHWQPSDGLQRDNETVLTLSESVIYGLLGLDPIDPVNREAAWIRQNVES
jgi:DNA polymerase/3'-5' exonuclease PolX